MNFKDAKKAVSEMTDSNGPGMVLTKNCDEFRVNFKGGKESTAYYTNDLEDAVMTAKSMWTSIQKGEYEIRQSKGL